MNVVDNKCFSIAVMEQADSLKNSFSNLTQEHIQSSKIETHLVSKSLCQPINKDIDLVSQSYQLRRVEVVNN